MKYLISTVMAVTLHFDAYAEDKSVFILTSQPDYKVANLVTSDALWQTVPKVQGKKFEFVSFVDAYRTFNNNVRKSIKEDAKKYNFDGVFNLEIKHSVDENAYHFSATFDYWRYKKN